MCVLRCCKKNEVKLGVLCVFSQYEKSAFSMFPSNNCDAHVLLMPYHNEIDSTPNDMGPGNWSAHFVYLNNSSLCCYFHQLSSLC